MDQERPQDAAYLSAGKIEALMRLAGTPPDEDLLGRHFDACAAGSGATSLSETEARWVYENLEANPAWQEIWRRREEDLGRPVSWQTPVVGKTGESALGQVRSVSATHDDSRRTTPDRAPQRHGRASRIAQRLAATVALLVVAYGATWFAGQAALPSTFEPASVSAYESHLARQSRNTNTSVESAVAEGAASLLEARKSTFGLFPRYDQANAQRAVRHLSEAYRSADDPFQRAEIAFFLAKAHLMQEDVAGARLWLNRVLSEQVADYRAEAERLLQSLGEEEG